MKTYVALLRGINVGRHKKVPMAELRTLLTNVGFQNVQTYIQSGNVVFQSSEKAIVLENILQNAIMNHFKFEVPVIIKSREELFTIFNACPFEKEKVENSYFIIFNRIPERELIDKVDEIAFETDEIMIIKDCLYLYCSLGYGQTKFNMHSFERKLNVVATSRNFKTMVKLLSLSSEN
ncbi:DUF1697 domain-containing protein [Yeosuana sp. AK3]